MIRFVRVTYVRPMDEQISCKTMYSPPPGFSYKTFIPAAVKVGMCSGAPEYESLSCTWERAKAWLKCVGVLSGSVLLHFFFSLCVVLPVNACLPGKSAAAVAAAASPSHTSSSTNVVITTAVILPVSLFHTLPSSSALLLSSSCCLICCVYRAAGLLCCTTVLLVGMCLVAPQEHHYHTILVPLISQNIYDIPNVSFEGLLYNAEP